ncbi:YfhO family protein [Furfurilactobacillus sp. WILCCON 0119]
MNRYGRRRFWYDLLAFLGPIVVVAITFACMHLTPFGNRSLLVSDMGTQYIAWLTQFRHAITTGQFSFYSFNLSLGDNAFPLVAYYMLSPFNLLLFFFPAGQVPLAVTFIIMLKVGAIGLSTSYYFRRVYHNTNWTNLLFGLVFSLSGFVATYFYDIMWLDALILLPLVMLGLRRLVEENRTHLYFFALWATIVTNYYLGYMTCLFAVCYFVYLLADAAPTGQSLLTTGRQQRPLIYRFIGVSALSGLSTLFILIPTLLGMLQTSKESLSLSAFLPTPQFGLEALVQLGMNGTNYTARLDHDPSLYMGSFALLLVIGFFLSPKISRHHKKTTGWLLGFLVISLFFTGLDTIWHMLQRPNGFPFRDVYFLTFVALICAYEAWQAHVLQDKRTNNRAFGISAILISVGYVTALIVQPFVAKHDPDVAYYISPWFWLVTLIGLAACWLLFRQTGSKRRYWAIAGLAVLTAAELGSNLFLGMAPAALGNQSLYAKNYDIEQTHFDKLQKDAHAFYRVNNRNSLLNDAYGESYNNYNDLLLFNSYGIDLYSSTLNESTRTMLEQLGFYSKNARRISAEGSTHLTNALLAVRYELRMTANNYQIIDHPTALPLGFAANEQVTHVKFADTAALTNQQRLWQGINGTKTHYFKRVKVTHVHRGQKVNSRYRYDLTVTPQATGTLYAYFPELSVEHAQISVNNARRHTRVVVRSQSALSLGSFSKGDTVHVQVLSREPIKQPEKALQTLDDQSFYHSLTTLHQSTLHLDKGWTPDHLAGTITIKPDKKMLFLSIPYDKGWHVYVDGQDATVQRVAGNLSAVKLQSGKHHVRLVYRAPGFRLGVIISILSVFFYISIYWWARFTHRN